MEDNEIIPSSKIVEREAKEISVNPYWPIALVTASMKNKHELIEIIRTSKDRQPLRDAMLTDAEKAQDIGSLVPITKGRLLVEQDIFNAAAQKVKVFGIELLDIRFKRVNYNESVRPKIYERMISERRQIAERFLSEGKGEAARTRQSGARFKQNTVGSLSQSRRNSRTG
jgi:hypothetical protein